MNINKITKLKNNKYKILIDGDNIITYDNVIIDNELLYKKTIDRYLYEKIVIDTKFYEVYYNTIRYIMKKRRSEQEIIDYLSKNNVSLDDINRIIDKLKKSRLIDDIEYCKAFMNDKIYLSKFGINKIRQELLKNGISIEIIDNELGNLDKSMLDDKLERLILKKINSNNKYSNSYLKQKILNEMMNLGYGKNEVLDILDKHIVDDTDIINKEFDKLFNKLKFKYSGIELENKIKQKLLYKGFKIDEINNLIQLKTEN